MASRHIMMVVAVAQVVVCGAWGGTLYWDGDGNGGASPAGSGTWDASSLNWNTAPDYTGTWVAWTNTAQGGEDVAFFPNIAGGATYTVTVSGTVSANELRFQHVDYTDNKTVYDFTGGAIELGGSGLIGADADALGVYLTFHTALQGSAGVTFDTRQSADLYGGNTYSGDTVIKTGGGRVMIYADGALPAATILRPYAPEIAGKIAINNGVRAMCAGIDGDFGNNGGVGGQPGGSGILVISNNTTDCTFVGNFFNEFELIKAGSFTQSFERVPIASSQKPRDFRIQEGVLALTGTNEVIYNSRDGTDCAIYLEGGSLRLDASNMVEDVTTIAMSGGTLDLNGFGETMNTLTLTDDATIDFGDGASILWFTGGVSRTSGALTIVNWDGESSGGGVDQFRVTAEPDSEVIDNTTFNGSGVAISVNRGGYWEIVPAPQGTVVSIQ